MELVTAVIVTRGDVPLKPILESLPPEWPVLIWDNSQRHDMSVYGRYQALYEIKTPLAFCQDDDVIVSDPQDIVDAWQVGHVVCNQPQEFRHSFYEEHALIGFGSCFSANDAMLAFVRYEAFIGNGVMAMIAEERERFYRCADVIFTTLTPRILVDVPKTDRPFASDPNRMWKQAGHYGERVRMLELARKVRDA